MGTNGGQSWSDQRAQANCLLGAETVWEDGDELGTLKFRSHTVDKQDYTAGCNDGYNHAAR